MSQQPLRIVALASPFGGTARTTVVAHVATLIARQGRAVLAVDLNAQNHLGGLLGVHDAGAPGWAASAADGRWWGDAVQMNTDGVALLPFGAASSGTLEALQRQMLDQPGWLAEQLGLLDVPSGCTVLLDTPVWPDPLARCALRCADTVLVTVEASARSTGLRAHVQALLDDSGLPAEAQGVLATRIDPRRVSHREALQSLRLQWGEQLVPYPLHEDDNIPRAIALGMTVERFTPHAQSSHDLQGVCNWVLGQRAPAPSLLLGEATTA